jgi:hypothetical protein
MKQNSSLYRTLMVRIKFDCCPICQRPISCIIDTGDWDYVCSVCQLRARIKRKTHEIIFTNDKITMSEEEFERFLKLKAFD